MTPGAVPDAAPPATQPPAPTPPTRRLWRALLGAGLLVGAIVLVFAIAQNWERWSGNADRQRTDDAFLQTDITPLGAKVSGYVLDSPVGDFAPVRRGQLLVALVPDDFRAQLAQQDAAVAAATATLANNRAQTELQRANVRAARAAVVNVEALVSRNLREATRQRRLSIDGAGTAQAQEAAETGASQSRAQLDQAHAQVDAALRQIDVLAAQREQAEAALSAARAARELATLNLAYTRIVAPDDGVVAARQVRVGQYVSIGQQVAIVAALPRLWVLANFKETQLRRMRPGQQCTISIDAFPGQELSGHVLGFAPGTGSQFALLPPDNATGNFTKVVQRVGVKIAIDDPGALRDLLRPGMSVVASVQVAE
jgi:membrane fusion protein (multidrug efflux system)